MQMRLPLKLLALIKRNPRKALFSGAITVTSFYYKQKINEAKDIIDKQIKKIDQIREKPYKNDVYKIFSRQEIYESDKTYNNNEQEVSNDIKKLKEITEQLSYFDNIINKPILFIFNNTYYNLLKIAFNEIELLKIYRFYYKSIYYFEAKNYVQSESEINKAIDTFEKHFDATVITLLKPALYNFQGLILRRTGKYKEAKEKLSYVLNYVENNKEILSTDINGKDLSSWELNIRHNLVFALSDNNLPVSALIEACNASQLERDNQLTLQAKAFSLHKVSLYQESYNKYCHLLKQYPNDKIALQYRAWLLLDASYKSVQIDMEEKGSMVDLAIKDCLKALEIDPNERYTRFYLAIAYAYNKDPLKAMKELDRLLTEFSNHDNHSEKLIRRKIKDTRKTIKQRTNGSKIDLDPTLKVWYSLPSKENQIVENNPGLFFSNASNICNKTEHLKAILRENTNSHYNAKNTKT